MCDVHLVPDVNVVVSPDVGGTCGECGGDIARGEPRRVIEGTLDDASPGRWRYTAHDDCYAFSVLDVSPSGCFTYGGVQPIPVPHT